MRDHKVLKVSRVMPDPKVHRGHKVIKGYKAFRDQPVLMGLTERRC